MARPGSDIPERLVEAARAQFLAQGVDGASLRAIAQEANTSIGMIYYHYRTKDELFLAVVEHIYEDLFIDLKAALDPALPVVERIERVFERFGRLSDDEAATIRMVVREALVSSERLTQVLQRFQRGHLPLMAQLLADGLAGGAFDAQHHPFAMLLALTTNSLFAQVIRRRIPDDAVPFELISPEALAPMMCQIFLHGVAGPSQPK